MLIEELVTVHVYHLTYTIMLYCFPTCPQHTDHTKEANEKKKKKRGKENPTTLQYGIYEKRILSNLRNIIILIRYASLLLVFSYSVFNKRKD